MIRIRWPRLMETLGTLVDAYEREHLRELPGDPAAVLRLLMDEHGLSQSDLPEVGSQGVVQFRGRRQEAMRGAAGFVPPPLPLQVDARRNVVSNAILANSKTPPTTPICCAEPSSRTQGQAPSATSPTSPTSSISSAELQRRPWSSPEAASPAQLPPRPCRRRPRLPQALGLQACPLPFAARVARWHA